MGRTYSYVIMFVSFFILMQFLGIGTVGTALQSALGLDDGLEQATIQGYNFQSTPLYNNLILVGLAVVIAGIAIGFFTKSQSENYVILPVITGTIVLLGDVVFGLLQEAQSFGNPWAAIIIMPAILLSVGFIFTLIEFFRGNV